ncbi:hypothetical protein BOTNAR_0513g00060 [Botryotinia narcissicola]|uniref:Calcineurin-like phosphoesterase domain-containing protein n=1 Tax=Botryotinia narcissicola TaxID=278944 RepID=A0A4Z1HK62_9HELO|nr:hypothetical protein BOTNAR_0513g00060 [Botryotinia narcissicola]
MFNHSYELDRLTYEPSHHSQDSCTTASSSHEPQNSYLTSSSPEPHIPIITRTTRTRKTRFVCVSDTHNGVANGSFKLPPGDVLIHAGDLTNQGNYAELEKSIKWIEDADFEAKIIIAGNHDITLDPSFYSQYGLYFHKQNPQDIKKCQELLDRSPSILYLNHEAAEVSLASATGPHTTFRIFGSPFSPAKGMWAFGYPQSDASKRWDDIPLDVDIVLTHTPPKYHCDERNDRVAAGCEYLRQALWRIRPRLTICGHVHEGRGAEIIQWDLGSSNIKFKENGVVRWEDPGGNVFKNDGAFGDWDNQTCDATASASNLTTSIGSGLPLLPEEITKERGKWHRNNSMARMAISNVAKTLLAIPEEILSPARGQGGVPPSLRCDVEALCGRMGRQETCVINAALMASSWPHGKGRGGKKFNKPIVVDIDLPVWEEVEL